MLLMGGGLMKLTVTFFKMSKKRKYLYCNVVYACIIYKTNGKERKVLLIALCFKKPVDTN